MKKQPRLSPVFVALSLASSPLSAAGQMRAQISAVSGNAVPVVPVGRLRSASGNSISTLSGPVIGRQDPLVAPSVVPSPLVSVVPSALAVVTRQTAAIPDGSNAMIVPTPGDAAMRIVTEASASSGEVPGLSEKESGRGIPSPKGAVTAPARSVAGNILDTLLRRPAAAVSFDGAREGIGAVNASVGAGGQSAAAPSGEVIAQALAAIFNAVPSAGGLAIAGFLNKPQYDTRAFNIEIRRNWNRYHEFKGGISGTMTDDAAIRSAAPEVIKQFSNPANSEDRFYVAQKLKSLHMVLAPFLSVEQSFQLETAADAARANLARGQRRELDRLMLRIAASLGAP